MILPKSVLNISRALVFNAALLLPTSNYAQSNDAPIHRDGFFHRLGDSLGADFHKRLEPKPLKWKAIVIPAGLIAYGTVSVTSGWLNDVNLLGKRWASPNEDPNSKTRIDDFTQYVPAIACYGLRIGGVRGKNNFVDATFMYAISNVLANAVVTPLKKLSAEKRPDSSDNLSFPSGHTTTAFVSAEFLRQEYKHVSPWIGAGGYAVAVLTGYLRMYNNKHWFSDVVTGAGIGILSTRATYWLYPKVKNAILGKDTKAKAMIMPTYENGAYGFCMVYGFK